MSDIKTPQQVKAELSRNGISIAKWATTNQVNPNLVYELLAGRKIGLRGQAHKAAVLLGLKSGGATCVEELHFASGPHRDN